MGAGGDTRTGDVQGRVGARGDSVGNDLSSRSSCMYIRPITYWIWSDAWNSGGDTEW